MKKRILAALAGAAAAVMLTTTQAHAAVAWTWNTDGSARGAVDKPNGLVLVDDVRADGRSAVTRWRAENSSGVVFDRDDCVDSNGANNGARACSLPRGFIEIKVCARDFSHDIGYYNCTAWEGYGWVN